MFKINLVPEVKQQQNKIRKANLTVTTVAIGVAITVGVLSLVLLGYIGARAAQISSINSETTKISDELKSYTELEKSVMTLEAGLTEIKQILKGGPKWSRFFAELEKATPGDVQITSFSIQNNQISLGLNGKEVKSVDRFIKSFSNYKVDDRNLFSNVEVTGYSKGAAGVTFQSKFNLNGGILW